MCFLKEKERIFSGFCFDIRRREGSFRELSPPSHKVTFCLLIYYNDDDKAALLSHLLIRYTKDLHGLTRSDTRENEINIPICDICPLSLVWKMQERLLPIMDLKGRTESVLTSG